LPAGSQLGEVDLAARFGVSRGPLREAIQRLAQEGLLTSIRNRGVFVIRLTAEDVADIYVAREAIENAAALLLLKGDRRAAVASLKEAYAQMAAAADARDGRGLSDADQRFHEILVEASRSPRLRRMASTVLVESRMCMTALEDRYQLLAEALHEHSDIVAAIEAGDPKAVTAAIHTHMRTGLRLLAPTAETRGDPDQA
jgi:DNA-binding GntR family transcriptional regulator